MSIIRDAADLTAAVAAGVFFAVVGAIVTVVGGVQYMYAKANDALVSQSIKSEKEDVYKKTKANLTEIFVKNSLPLAKENDEISEYLKCSVDAISEAKASQTASSKYVEEKNGLKIGAANALWDVTYLRPNVGEVKEGGAVFRDAAIKGIETCYDALLVGKSVLPPNSEALMLATKSFVDSYDGIDRNISLERNNAVSLNKLKDAVSLAYNPVKYYKKDAVTGVWMHNNGTKVYTEYDTQEAVTLPLSETELACLNERLSQAALDAEDSFGRNSGPYLMSASDWKIRDDIKKGVFTGKIKGYSICARSVSGDGKVEDRDCAVLVDDFDDEMRKRSSEAQKNNMTALADKLSEKFQNALSTRGVASCLSTRGVVQRQQIESDLKWLSPKVGYDFLIRR